MTIRFHGGFLRLVLALAIAVATVCPAFADDQDQAALERKKEQLFERMLANPADLDVLFAYADVSAKLGDSEAAISALQQMLLFNPNLPRVDLELGALYFRLGSLDVARSYFQKAADAHPPPEVQQRIDKYMAQIGKQNAQTQLTGYFFFGAQYQSDANIAPANSMIVSPIGPVLLNQQFVKESDFDIFASGSLLYTYDFGDQNHDTLEVAGHGLVNHYMKVGRLDLDFAEVTAGPRLRFPELPDNLVTSATVKPYAIFNEVGLGEHQYFDTYGAGFEATGVVWNDIALRGAFEFRQKTFDNAVDRPASIGLTGNDKLMALQATKPLPWNSDLTLEFDYVDQLTKFSYYANQSYAGAATYHIRYDGPQSVLPAVFARPMETSFYVNRVYSLYFAPDPCCVTGSGFSSRDDRRWRIGLIQGVQLTDDIELVLQVERDIVSSNLSLYGYTSNSVVLGPQIKF
jgi:Tetratricopeptide repeat